jgi:hypothetical protein
MNDQERYPDPAEIRHEIGANGQLTINNVSGDIEIRATDETEAVVIARSEGGRSDWLPLAIRKSDGVLTIDVEKRSGLGMLGSIFGGHDGIEFDVAVPRGARVSINTVSSDIRSHFLTGEQSYKSVSGDIEVDPDGGRVRATTVSGDLEIRASEPIELNASTTSGDIRVSGAVLNALDIRTVSGDIEFEAGLATGPLHTIESISGDLSVESTTGVTVDVKSSMNFGRDRGSTMIAGDGAAQLRFRTLSGDCHVAGARREERSRDRHGKRGRQNHEERRMEREAERHAERVARDFADDDTRGWDIRPPMPPMPPMQPMSPIPPQPAPTAARPQVDQLDVLRALERGEIDVEEASRRLQEA